MGRAKCTLPTSTDPRPVQEIIDQTYRSKRNEWSKAWKEFGKKTKKTPSLPLTEFFKAFPLFEEFCQLETWARPEEYTLAARRRRKAATRDALYRARVPLEAWGGILETFSKAGAPVKLEMRRLAVQALDSWRSDPSFSWQRFANNHCNCGKATHDTRCKERIRQAAIALQRLLKRLGVELKKLPCAHE